MKVEVEYVLSEKERAAIEREFAEFLGRPREPISADDAADVLYEFIQQGLANLIAGQSRERS